MEGLLRDARHGLRSLVQRPGFTVVTVLTLALGIGANTALFSVVNTVMLRDLPYSEPDRLAIVWEANQTRGKDRNVVGPSTYLAWRDEARSFEQLAAFVAFRTNLTGVEQPEELIVQAATPNFFDLLGVSPARGRGFEEADAVEGAPDVVVLSHELWQRRFGGDPGIVGKTVELNSEPQTVVGIMPPDFQLTLTEGSLADGRAELYMPMGFTEAQRTPRGRYLTVIGRLAPSATVESATAEMEALTRRLEERFPDFYKAWSASVVPLKEQIVGGVRTPLLVLLGAVAFVLLVACANVANLLLMRSTARRKELAVRSALGASRWRIARQLLTESVLLAGIGGLLGLAVAFWGVDLLLAMRPSDMIVLSDVGIDLRVLAFTLGISVATGLVFGVVPAFQASRSDVNDALKEGGRHATTERGGLPMRHAFVVSEVALALVLLVGAGLLLRSFATLQSVDPGFSPENLLTFRLQVTNAKYPEDPQQLAFFDEVVERIETVPGVRSASAISFLPFAGLGSATSYILPDRPSDAAGGERPTCDVSVVREDFFETMGIPLLAGRTFAAHEFDTPTNVIVVSETLARQAWPNEDPIGKQIVVHMRQEESPSTVIGVVRDIHRAGLDVEPKATVYWPHPEIVYNAMTVVARTDGDPLSVVSGIDRVVKSMDADIPLADVQPMTARLGESLSQARFTTFLLAIFAGVAFLLAVVGIYGVLAYSVVQRTQEIAIRSALGAQRGDILRMVVRQGMTLAAAGVAIGVAAALAMNRFVESLLFSVSATDAATYVIVALVFLGVALLACLIPGRRATNVHPAEALR